MAPKYFSSGRRRLLLAAGAGVLLVPLAACSGSRAVAVDTVSSAATAAPPPAARSRLPPLPHRSPPRPPPAATVAPVRGSVQLVPLVAAEESKVEQWQRQGWQINFSIKSVDLREIRQAAAARDIIPPMDELVHSALSEVDEFLDDREPVAVLEHGGESRAYPLQILTWHEIVNDTVGGELIIATYCPLCNTAVGFR